MARKPTAAELAMEDPSVLRARIKVDRVRIMVDSGTLPKIKLDEAEAELEDTMDEAVLTRALYGRDLTVQQAGETVAAAKRRVDRRKKILGEQKKLVDMGVIAKTEMTASSDDVDRAQKEYDWAVARTELVRQIESMAANEAELMRQLATASPMESRKLAEYYAGKGTFSPTDLQRVEVAFSVRFGKPLPISANGESAVHRSLGFDHRGRVDVAVTPDQPEGVWLRHYLTANRIPFFAFRRAIAHQATGAHIHMGPPSTRYFASAMNSGG
jgi:hypothetical protein